MSKLIYDQLVLWESCVVHNSILMCRRYWVS